MSLIRGFILLPFLLIMSIGAVAAPLTESQISGFIDSMPELQQYAKQNKLDFDRNGGRHHPNGNPFASGIPQLKATGHYSAASGIVGKHGFSSLESWAETANRIMQAYISNKMGAQQPQAAGQMQQAMQMIQSNPNMSADQKRMAMEQMSAALQSMQSMQNADPADKRAVAPHIPRLEAVLDSGKAN